MKSTIVFSSVKSEWETPQPLFDKLNEQYHFTLDACATQKNAKCARYFTQEDDALQQEWTGRIFMNPPYGKGQTARWVKKAYESSLQGAFVVCLIPARTDTPWWHDYCLKGEIIFIRGRLRFSGTRQPAPFPSVLVVFHPFGKQQEKKA